MTRSQLLLASGFGKGAWPPGSILLKWPMKTGRAAGSGAHTRSPSGAGRSRKRFTSIKQRPHLLRHCDACAFRAMAKDVIMDSELGASLFILKGSETA
jgi:hypothetical protein